MVGMYAFAMVLTLLAALVLGRTVVRGHQVPLILELPPYRVPSVLTTAKMVRERSWDFVREAGTIILLCTVGLWALLTFPRAEVTPPTAVVTSAEAPSTVQRNDHPSARQPTAPRSNELETSAAANVTPPSIENSYGARLGKALEPVIEPLGFDWRIGVGLVGAFAAREVFVSTMALVYRDRKRRGRRTPSHCESACATSGARREPEGTRRWSELHCSRSLPSRANARRPSPSYDAKPSPCAGRSSSSDIRRCSLGS
ncbi:MAG: nucleoside recognition domain-containing protein [Polyangiaceae bacterium]